MFKFKDYFQKLHPPFLLENLLNYVVAVMILSMIFVSFLALKRPINPQQYKNIIQYSEQASFPKTQQLAKHLQKQERIEVYQYFHLLRAYHFEHQHVKEYPAVDGATQYNDASEH